MKFISPIQSFSDIITNSSSEVFLMDKEDATHFDSMNNWCIDVERISSLDWIKSHWYYSDLFCSYLNASWDEIMENELMQEKLIGLYVVDIEDHFSNYKEVYEEARDLCFASLYSH